MYGEMSGRPFFINEIINKKKHGGELSKEEINFFVNGFVENLIPDYQISALLMAIWFQGLNNRETVDLTTVMADSGERNDLSGIKGIKVDKHSTGGVADTTTLIAAPLVAACGGKVAKMSGRGLGHTGGTLDKLESIPGLSVEVEFDRFAEIVNSCGLSIIGQSADIVPADKKLYALRDVTATVDNTSLIAASIMSKKLAAGADAIVLDVKLGSGAFMKDMNTARDLARTMVNIGGSAGKKTVALITDMNQPLGCAVGNALEVCEAIEILQGERGGDLKTLSFALAAEMLMLAKIAGSSEDAQNRLENAVSSGKAIDRLECMIKAQGGNASVVHDTGLLPRAAHVIPVISPGEGFISCINAFEIGMSALRLGAGRTKKTDIIDPAVGIWMKKRLGEQVAKGEVIAEFHVNDQSRAEIAMTGFLNSIEISRSTRRPVQLIYDRIESEE